jgi:hypothetical protein
MRRSPPFDASKPSRRHVARTTKRCVKCLLTAELEAREAEALDNA